MDYQLALSAHRYIVKMWICRLCFLSQSPGGLLIPVRSAVEVSENHVFSEGTLGEISESDRIKIKKNTIFLLAFACTEL